MRKVLVPAVLGFLVWLVATWSLAPASVIAGVAAALIAALALRGIELDDAALLLVPDRLFWALVYLPVLLWHIVRANLDVAYRVLHPALPIRPGIVKVTTTLRSEAGRVLLANSITLTPGTLAVDLVGDTLYVHRIWVPENEPEDATRRNLAQFETWIRRIFE